MNRVTGIGGIFFKCKEPQEIKDWYSKNLGIGTDEYGTSFEWLVDQFRKDGVTVLDEIKTYEYGKFVHILDTEGNKIELWEPNDGEYDKIVESRTK